MRQRVKRFARALDTPSVRLSGPVEIDEVYVFAGLKGRERDQTSRSRALSTRGRGTYEDDKPPVFTLVDRGTDERYVVPAKSADESNVRLLLANHEQESLTVYTDGFRAYDPLEDDDEFQREFVVHSDSEYADDETHINICESHGSLLRLWLSPHRGVSKDRLTSYIRAFQLHREVFRNPVKKRSKRSSKLRCDSPTIYAIRAFFEMKSPTITVWTLEGRNHSITIAKEIRRMVFSVHHKAG